MGARIIASRVSNRISRLRYVKLIDNPWTLIGSKSLLCLRIVMLDYCGLLPQVFDDPVGL